MGLSRVGGLIAAGPGPGGFSPGLGGVTFAVDGSEVCEVIGSALGGGGEVVDLGCAELAAEVAPSAVSREDRPAELFPIGGKGLGAATLAHFRGPGGAERCG